MPFSNRVKFYQKFRFQVLFRITTLAALVFLLSYLMKETELYATIAIAAVMILFLIYSLFRYVEKTNQDLARFFQAVRYSDFSRSFARRGMGSGFDELHAALAEVIMEFQKARAAKEEQSRYLQTVVQHVGIGLIAYQPDGKVELINNAARRLLGIPHIKNIQTLSNVSSELVEKLPQLHAGEKVLVKLQDNGEIQQLSVYATEFKLKDRRVTLVSLQNIQSELEEKEMEAWQKLIRVLTHEIMNSITPIASLASTVNKMLESADAAELQLSASSETIDDVRSAVSTIQRRSEGLLRFIESYRSLSRLPKPKFQIFEISTLVERVKHLMLPQLQEKAIQFEIKITPPHLELTADPELIEQVLINLILNAKRALADALEPKIEITAFLNEKGRIIIQVSDNGIGVPEELQETIFIPFFTTDKKGSGVGLSICRQIMRLHRGTISVSSPSPGNTVFTLRF
jgi:two-component system nitrogen regulation sensor histidine kinase NtrY